VILLFSTVIMFLIVIEKTKIIFFYVK